MQNSRDLLDYNENIDETQESAASDQDRGRYEALTTEQQTLSEYQSLQRSQQSTTSSHGEISKKELKSTDSEQIRKIKICLTVLGSLMVVPVAVSVIAITIAAAVAANQSKVVSLQDQIAILQQQIINLQTTVNSIDNQFQNQFPLALYQNCRHDTSSCITRLSNGSNLLSCKTTPLNVTETVS